MEMFQVVMAALLTGIVFNVMAADAAPGTSAKVDTQEYSYSQELDVAKVISMSQVPDICAVVPAEMVYEDSTGQRHTLTYKVMGNGCSNG